ncbi:MAG: alpha-amylase family glycosyl hydrolase [Melioribacteraceae bacterium]|nr:alpha-amylase family glycosyl hydrolase [Melioribacteraceae bacterium]
MSRKIIILINFLFLIITIHFVSCQPQDEINNLNNATSFKPPEWSNNSTIYEVNVRQFTQEGTFNAFASHLPKLKEMGIDILWLMPIHPIGLKNRKGTLGSYYSVKDYTDINPEFGTLDDFKNLVKDAHELGMYVIIDWVANHTSWDNVWTEKHPEFFTRDSKGNYVSPYDWTDVIDLNYDNKELWNYMRDAMKYWVDECDIDGFRCDVAAMVPLEFWKWLRPQLESSKKLFMLAEAHEPELHKAFDMTYNWQLKDLFVDIAKGTKSPDDLYRHFEEEKSVYPKDAFRMVFTTNHDENSWQGTDIERFGDFAEQFAVISCVVSGMPLVYSGMESGLNKRLKFFEKDPILWKESKYRGLYTKLFSLKKHNPALWNGSFGGEMNYVDTGIKQVFSFVRQKDDNKIFALFNLSKNSTTVSIDNPLIDGEYKSLFSEEIYNFNSKKSLTLEPYSYLILFR